MERGHIVIGDKLRDLIYCVFNAEQDHFSGNAAKFYINVA